jgi:hypothetical protein
VRTIISAVLLVASVLASTTSGVESPVPQAQTRAGDVEYLEVAYGFLGIARLRVLRLNPDGVELRLVSPPEGATLAAIPGMPGCEKALACVNGPFFDLDDSPIGLLVSQEVVEQPLRNVSWGVFWIDRKGKPHVDRRKDFQSGVDPASQVRFAIQSGPTIVRRGKVLERAKRDVARRTAIGIDSLGRVLILVAGWPISLNSLAEVARDKLDLKYLMNLDGGSSTQLMTEKKLGAHQVRGVPVARAIGLFAPNSTNSQ